MKCTIDIAQSGSFILEIPSTILGQSHNIEVPANGGGIAVLRKILIERQRETRKEIGNVSSPSQMQVEAWLAQDRRECFAKPEKEEDTKITAAHKIDLLGLNIGDLEL